MNDEIQKKEEWYETLVSECKEIITESVFTSRWALVEGYWSLGKRIAQDDKFAKFAKGNLTSLSDLSKNINVGERTIYRALQVFNKYPDIDMLPEGKNISWNKLITKYLPQEKREETKLPDPPTGKYNVIYADPPWDIGSMVLEKWESPLEDKYPTMSEDELSNLMIPSLAANDCVLFMWTTLSTLPQAIRLLEHWGFKYHITLTWDKGNGWSSTGFHRRTELVLVGYIGKITNVIKQTGEYIPTIFTEQKTVHSRKPEIMYKFIEDRTNGTKIELFARLKREGWDSWGNEV